VSLPSFVHFDPFEGILGHHLMKLLITEVRNCKESGFQARTIRESLFTEEVSHSPRIVIWLRVKESQTGGKMGKNDHFIKETCLLLILLVYGFNMMQGIDGYWKIWDFWSKPRKGENNLLQP
jgi:hypothetical protein